MYKSIVEIEEVVGKKATDVIVRAREIIIVFAGGRNADGSPAAAWNWHLKRT